MSLTSTKIKDIFNRELDGEEDDPYSKTVKRVMKQLARFSDGLLEFDTDTNPNRIRADKDDWEELLVRVEEGMNGDDPDDPVNPETGSGEGSYSEDGKDDTVVSVSDAEEVGRQ